MNTAWLQKSRLVTIFVRVRARGQVRASSTAKRGHQFRHTIKAVAVPHVLDFPGVVQVA